MNQPFDFDNVPINRLLGLTLRESTPTGATIAFEPRTVHQQMYEVVHGGILATVADTAAVFAFHPDLQPGERMTSIEFKINFLAPAKATAGTILATSTIVRRGRTIGVADVNVTQGGTLVAKGLFTYVFLRPS